MTRTYFNSITFYSNLENIECDRYRVYNIIEALIKKGIQCRLLSFVSSQNEIDEAIENSDIFIFFKTVMNPKINLILKRLKNKTIPVVFDADDLLFEVEGVENEYVRKGIKETLESCDYFTGSTETLVKNAPVKGFLIRNTINPAQFKLAEKLIAEKTFLNEKIKLGYFSGNSTHSVDFLKYKSLLLTLLGKYKNLELHVVGYLEIDEDFSKYESQIVKAPYMNYLKMLEYLSKMDINIAPLEKTMYNDSKSELKIFEAGLVQVPTVASPTQSYKDCIKDGVNGYLASTPDEWLEKITKLIENPDLKKKIALQARKDFIEKFYIDNNIDHIIDIYNSISSEEAKNLFEPMQCYNDFCNRMNFAYTKENLKDMDLLTLFYKDESGFNPLIAREINTEHFKEKIKSFIKENKNKKICFWGGGKFFRDILIKFDLSELNIVGIIDKDPNTQIDKYNIIPPEKIKDVKPDLVVLSVMRPYTIEKEVKEFLSKEKLDIKLDNIIDLWFSKKYNEEKT